MPTTAALKKMTPKRKLHIGRMIFFYMWTLSLVRWNSQFIWYELNSFRLKLWNCEMNLFRLKLWICEMNSFMLKLWICEMNHLYSNLAFGTRTLFILNFCTDFYSYTYVFFCSNLVKWPCTLAAPAGRQPVAGRPAGQPAWCAAWDAGRPFASLPPTKPTKPASTSTGRAFLLAVSFWQKGNSHSWD